MHERTPMALAAGAITLAIFSCGDSAETTGSATRSWDSSTRAMGTLAGATTTIITRRRRA